MFPNTQTCCLVSQTHFCKVGLADKTRWYPPLYSNLHMVCDCLIPRLSNMQEWGYIARLSLDSGYVKLALSSFLVKAWERCQCDHWTFLSTRKQDWVIVMPFPQVSVLDCKKSLGMRLIPSSQFGLHCGFLALLTSGSEYMYQWAESKQFDWMAQLSLSQQLRTPQYARVNVAAELGSGLTCLPTLPLHTVNWLWGMEYVSVCWEIWSYCHKMSSSPSQGSSTSQRTTTGENCSKMQVTV